MALYKGFSTISGTSQFTLTDFELAKQDLLNHFNIRKGEKLMNPDYGTIIWDTLFDPLDEPTKQLIYNDVKQIVAADPRITATSVVVTEYELGIQLELNLVFVQTNETGTLIVQFDQNSKTSTRK
jgi:phage baseplate assembly protein W